MILTSIFSTYIVGHRVKCVNPIHGRRKVLHGLVEGKMYTIERSWVKKGGRKNRRKHLVILKEIPNCVFSASRFEPSSMLPEDLFTI